MTDAAPQAMVAHIGPEGRIHYGDEAALFALTREMRPVRVIARFTVDGEPVSKARARFTKQGSRSQAYTPEKTRTAEEKVAWLFRRTAPGHRVSTVNTFGVCALFFHGTRQRRDVDNMIKLICDALNGIAWADDSQVEEVSGRRGYGPSEHARTEVLIYEIGRIEPTQTIRCLECGAEAVTYGSWTSRKFCSRECSTLHHRKARLCTCLHCGKEFDGVKTVKRPLFCSRACSDAHRNVEVSCVHCGKAYLKPRSLNKGRAFCSEECRRDVRKLSRPGGTCTTCGGPTSKKTYTNCAACRSRSLRKAGAAS